MILERFEDKGLSHYSYAVGCLVARDVAIVDPRRDIDVYLDYAAREGLRIAYVLETHIHADFASGAKALAERTGAELWLSAYDANELYETSFPHTEMHDGDSVTMGAIRVQALHTPGHTPEHLSFLVYDGNRSATVPMVMLSGDFLFVGSLGRPDLLGEEAKRGLANQLYDSVTRKLAGLPDGLEVHPAHGAGSMCGAGMSGRPMSTLGFERIANPYLDPTLTREAFVARILGNVPPFPPYYRRMKVLNAAGPASLPVLPGGKALEADDVAARLADGAVLVDLSGQADFGAGHVPGALGIGARDSVSIWASWMVPYDRPIVLSAPDAAALDEAQRAFVRVGLDDIVGHLAGGTAAWAAAGHPLQALPQWSPAALAARLAQGNGLVVLDVRNDDEFRAGHVPGSRHLMGGNLPERMGELPRDAEIVVTCRSGYRSTVAASLLQQAGFSRVANLAGGLNAWREAGLDLA